MEKKFFKPNKRSNKSVSYIEYISAIFRQITLLEMSQISE